MLRSLKIFSSLERLDRLSFPPVFASFCSPRLFSRVSLYRAHPVEFCRSTRVSSCTNLVCLFVCSSFGGESRKNVKVGERVKQTKERKKSARTLVQFCVLMRPKRASYLVRSPSFIICTPRECVCVFLCCFVVQKTQVFCKM